MEDYEKATVGRSYQPPAAHHRWSNWLLISGLAFAFLLALGIGVLLGSMTSTTHAASVASVAATSGQSQLVQTGGLTNAQSPAFAPGAQGQCATLTVSSVNGNTIVAKTASGSSVTIHTTASTKYTQARATVSASTIKVGSVIHVMGTHNSDGSITATSIDIG